jgi:hypothetical protein
MENVIDSKFTENTEAIISQFGFKDLKSLDHRAVSISPFFVP